jgi:hypothetical protein
MSGQYPAQLRETDILKLPPTKNWRAIVAIGVLDTFQMGSMCVIREFQEIYGRGCYQKVFKLQVTGRLRGSTPTKRASRHRTQGWVSRACSKNFQKSGIEFSMFRVNIGHSSEFLWREGEDTGI